VEENEYTIWLKLSCQYFDTEKDIFIGAIYMPPESSSYYRNNESVDPFLVLESAVMKYGDLGEILLMGDFNARTATLKDYIEIETHNDHFPLQSKTPSALSRQCCLERNNLDTKVNSFGRKLITLCKNADIAIMNGRIIGDLSGAYTCFQYNGKSLVDYAIAGASLIPLCQSLIILSLNLLSTLTILVYPQC